MKKIYIILALFLCIFSIIISVKAIGDIDKVIVVDPGHGDPVPSVT